LALGSWLLALGSWLLPPSLSERNTTATESIAVIAAFLTTATRAGAGALSILFKVELCNHPPNQSSEESPFEVFWLRSFTLSALDYRLGSLPEEKASLEKKSIDTVKLQNAGFLIEARALADRMDRALCTEGGRKKSRAPPLQGGEHNATLF
jgi:hypothetical protein